MAERKGKGTKRVVLEVNTAEQGALLAKMLLAQAQVLDSLGRAQTPTHEAVLDTLVKGKRQAGKAAEYFRRDKSE